MESARRGKRKSPCQDMIFELSDGDLSPDLLDSDFMEPDIKISRLDITQLNEEHPNFSSDKEENEAKVCDKDFHPSAELSQNSLKVGQIEDIDQSTPDLDLPSQKNPQNLEDGELAEKLNRCEDSQDVPDSSGLLHSPCDTNFDSEAAASENIIDSSNIFKKPCITINFRDDVIADLYKFKFLKFLESFVEFEVVEENDYTINILRDNDLDPSEWVILDETVCVSNLREILEESPQLLTPVSHDKGHKKKKKRKIKEKAVFVLDSTPSSHSVEVSTKYLSKFQIDTAQEASEDESAAFELQTVSCFNCNGKHAMKDCYLPKNYSKINLSRQQFKNQKQSSRYHLEEDQKYGHLVPGKLSHKLREALGIHKNELPSYIYHMRVLGYPPGWLEEAKFIYSDLEMFDSEGNNVKHTHSKKSQGLDPAQIIDYPGFNVPPEKHSKDEFKLYRVPPYSEKFGKNIMIEYFEKDFARKQDDFEACDMDLDTTYQESEEKVGQEEGKEIPIKSKLSDVKTFDANTPSPSLIELETQKESLLAALQDNSDPQRKFGETLRTSEEKVESKIAESEDSAYSSAPLVLDVSHSETDASPQNSPNTNNSIKNSIFGTPILKSNSPYSHLPCPDNFMKNVSPVINFENLPNSTGKYEQMVGVLQKVRNTLKGLQNCKS